MAHKHPIYDTDPHFKIDGDTRVIINASDVKVALMQGDHNSERFTFEIPRYVDGHDMSLCNICQIHYLNVASSTRATNAGIYEVEDLQFDPNDEQNRVVLSWLISSNVTMYVGSLSFVIRFGCSTDGVVDYIWNTAVHSGITISSSICNSETVVQDYADILEQWRDKLEDSVTALKEDLGYVDSSLFTKEIMEIDYDSKYDGFALDDGFHPHATRKCYRYNISGKQIIQVRGYAGSSIPLCVCFNSQDTVLQKFNAEKAFNNTVWQTITTPESTAYIYVNDNDNLGKVGCKAEKINKSYNARNHIEKAESDISGIKEDMVDKYSDVTSECSDWIYNTYYDASKTNGKTPTERTDGNYSTRKIVVSKGEKYKLTTVIGYVKAYIMADNNYDYLGNEYMYPQSSHAWKQEVVNITIPDNCKYLLFTATSEYVGVFKLERLSGLTFEAKENNDVNFDLENWKERVSEKQAKNDFAWNTYDKGYVTFVMDDTRDQTGQFVDLFISKNTPLCIAAIPSFLGNLVQNSNHGKTIKEVLDAVVKNGGEILAHGGGTFSTALTADSTDEDYYHTIVDSKKVLTKAGYEINGIITIGGGATAPDYEKCVKIMRPYYRYSDYYGHKTGVIQYDHERLGCYGLTLENLKAKVDECVLNKSWLVLFWHNTNEITLDNMSALIDYINTVNAEIITYKDLHDRFGSSKLERRIKALGSVTKLKEDVGNILSPNLYNPANAKENTAISQGDGTEISFDGWIATEYIPVYKGEVLYFSSNGEPTPYSTGAFYDKNKQRVDSFGNPDNNNITVTSDGYARFSFNFKREKLQIEKGSITTYIPYGELKIKVDVDNVKEDTVNIKAEVSEVKAEVVKIQEDHTNLFNKDTVTKDSAILSENGYFYEGFSGWDASDYIPVKPGMVLYFSSNELPIGVASTGAYFDKDKRYLSPLKDEPLSITIPDGAYFIRFSKNGGFRDTLNTLKIEQHGITKFTPYGELYITVNESALPSSILPKWKGLKILTLGDSITAMGGVNGWTYWIKQYLLADKVVNVSVAGSTWQDKVANQVYDGNPQPSTDGNVMGNQVQKVLNAKANGDADYQDFDVITFSFGTNDSVDFSMQTKESVESQFITNYAQNNFTVVPLENVNRQTLAGAIRYGFQKLHEAYPNAVIFMCTPTQECYETFDSIYQKGDFIDFIADRLGAETIDTRRCGIRNIYESQTKIDYDHPEQSGTAPIQTDLLDGIHTNENGAKKIAKYNAREIMKYFMIN